MTGVTRKPAENKHQAMKPGKPGFTLVCQSPLFSSPLTLSLSFTHLRCSLLRHPLYHDCRVHDFSFHTATFVSNINQSLSIRCSDHIKCFGNIIKASCFTNGSFKPWIALLMLVLLHFDSFFFYRPSSLTLSSSWSSISPPISHPQTYKTAVHSSSRSAFSSFSLSFSSPTRFLLPYKTPLLRYKLISLQRERKYKRHTQNIYITFTYTYHTSRYISRYDDLHNAQAEQCHPGQNTCIGSQHECTYFSITKSLLLVWLNKAYVIRLPIVRINIDENDWTWQSFANNKWSSSSSISVSHFTLFNLILRKVDQSTLFLPVKTSMMLFSHSFANMSRSHTQHSPSVFRSFPFLFAIFLSCMP